MEDLTLTETLHILAAAGTPPALTDRPDFRGAIEKLARHGLTQEAPEKPAAWRAIATSALNDLTLSVRRGETQRALGRIRTLVIEPERAY